jgi:hypothetical protein
MADIQPGDVVVDPMCGGASIGIEVCNVLPFCLRVSVHMYDCMHKINDLCTSNHLVHLCEYAAVLCTTHTIVV